ncbi:MAG: SDR family NAD(P)-dependent oxidoreductase [Planctomycetota bacterium]
MESPSKVSEPQASFADPILVTGCAGFIGARTCEMLCEQGHRVVGIDNLNDYYSVSLKKHRLEQLQNKSGFEFHKMDIEDAIDVDSLYAKYRFECVINLAARAGVRYSMENPAIYMRTNSMGTMNLLEAMRHHGGKKFVLASTSSLYAGLPMPFTEDLPVNTPISPYAASKKSAEAMAYTYHYLYDIDVTILRYFTVYGPADRPDMAIHRFIKNILTDRPIKIFGDGSAARDFTYIDDVARGTIAAMRPLGHEIINLGGGGSPIRIDSIIELIEEICGTPAKLEYRDPFAADMQATRANIDKAEQTLEWCPTVQMREGLESSVAWHQENT